jgi:hypothetical protein
MKHLVYFAHKLNNYFTFHVHFYSINLSSMHVIEFFNFLAQLFYSAIEMTRFHPDKSKAIFGELNFAAIAQCLNRWSV